MKAAAYLKMMMLLLAVAPMQAKADPVDVGKLAGQSLLETQATLGKAKECHAIKYGKECNFLSGAVEIVFINAKADWITIYPDQALEFSAKSLSYLGLPTTLKPKTQSAHVLNWNDVSGLKEISIFPTAQGTVDYMYVKATTL